MASPLRCVVLAAGAGRRLSDVTGGVPKQFWRSGNRPSLLQETITRIDPLVARGRTTVVVDRTHEGYAESVPSGVHLIYQPCDRGTAAGVLLGLTPALAADRNATIVLTPSDHGVARLSSFRGGLLKAAAAVASRAVETVLFGVTPTAATADYGWITPGPSGPATGAAGLRQVLRFVEKPPLETAVQLFQVGCLWNTMILVSRVGAIADLYSARLPDVARVFANYRRCPAAAREAYLADAYSSMPSYDFSRDVLSSAAGLAVFTWPASLGWTDLGTPGRLARWHQESAPAASAGVALDAPA